MAFTRRSDVVNPVRHGRRRAGLALAAAAALVLGFSAPAVARDLSSQVLSHEAGSTGVHSAFNDPGTYMRQAWVWHFDTLQPQRSYCGAQAKVWGTLTSGSAWSRTFGYQSGCWLVQVDETTNPNQYFQGGSNFFGQAYHDGSWAPGTPSIKP